jgi:hypothetical protein
MDAGRQGHREKVIEFMAEMSYKKRKVEVKDQGAR